MALTISTGFVVDDAIVMIENIARYIEEGDAPFEAALKGAKQIGFTIVSLTVSLVAVLIPLLFMGGLIGRLFREFAVTLAIADRRLRGALAHADADDVRAPPAASTADGEARACSTGGRSAASTAMIALLRRAGSTGCSATRRLTLLVTIATLGVHRSWRSRSRRVLPAARHRAHPRRHRGGARRLVPADDGAAASARRRRPAGSRRRDGRVVHRLRRHEPDDEQRPLLHHAQAPRQRRPRAPTRSSRASQPKLAQVDGIALYLAGRAGSATSTAASSRTQYQYTLEDADPTSSRDWAPQVLEKLADAAAS